MVQFGQIIICEFPFFPHRPRSSPNLSPLSALSSRTHPEMRPLLDRAKMDFGNNEHMRAFPKEIGDWKGSDYNTMRVEKRLAADVMLMRAYSNPKLYQSVFFLIVQSN